MSEKTRTDRQRSRGHEVPTRTDTPNKRLRQHVMGASKSYAQWVNWYDPKRSACAQDVERLEAAIKDARSEFRRYRFNRPGMRASDQHKSLTKIFNEIKDTAEAILESGNAPAPGELHDIRYHCWAALKSLERDSHK